MNRNCVKYGELQVKSQKKSGTLLRKKKYVYEDERWVAFCIHDDKVPLLEWYYSEGSVAEHEPLKVQDLFGCLFVNVAICDDRCFIIGFTDYDRPAIELSAASARECIEWVHEISLALKRLNYLDESENIYSELPLREPDPLAASSEEKRRSRNSDRNSHPSVSPPPLPPALCIAHPPVSSPSTSTRNKILCLSDKIPMQPASSSGYLKLEEKWANKSVSTPNVSNSTPLKMPLKLQQQLSVKESESNSNCDQLEEYPPPLPPRQLNFLPSTSPSSHNSIPIACASPGSVQNSNSQYDFTNSPPPNYEMLNMRSGEVEPFYNLLVFTDHKKTSFDMQELNEEMKKEEFRPNSSCTIRSPQAMYSPESRNSAESQLVQDNNYIDISPHLPQLHKRQQYDLPSSPPPSSIKHPLDTFRETLSRPKIISLLLTICVEHIAFVEVGGKVWIAGWNPEKDNYLRNIIHFGDEVVQIGNVAVRSIQQISTLFFTQSLPGTPIALTIRSIPYGLVYSITKPLNPKKSLGIVLHKKKNMIAFIEDRSEALHAKLPSKVAPYVYGSAEVSAVITEIDGIPMNPFAKNEQLFHRLERLSQGTVFNVVVHPRDLVKLLKQKLKHCKNYKKLIHDL